MRAQHDVAVVRLTAADVEVEDVEPGEGQDRHQRK
jgi:hypothetical protein